MQNKHNATKWKEHILMVANIPQVVNRYSLPLMLHHVLRESLQGQQSAPHLHSILVCLPEIIVQITHYD
jgi:hypothetical protein